MDKKRGILQGAPPSGFPGCPDAHEDPPSHHQVHGRLRPSSAGEQAPPKVANATTAHQAGIGTAGAATTGWLTTQILYFICQWASKSGLFLPIFAHRQKMPLADYRVK